MDVWTLTAHEPTKEALYLANGYLGTSLPWDCGLLAGSEGAPCYIRGVYDNRGPGGVDRLAEVPRWNDLRYGAETRLRTWERGLDLRHGVLRTVFDLEEDRGNLQLEHTTFHSRADPHLVVTRIRILPQFEGTLTFTAGLAPSPDTGITVLGAEVGGRTLSLRSRSDCYGIEMKQSLAVLEPEWQIEHETAEDGAGCVLSRVTERGRYTSLTTVARTEASPDPCRAADPAGSYDTLLRRHKAAWERLWETDLQIDGDPEVQQFARSGLFYLWSTMLEDDAWSIAPMGLSGNFYNGHIFWDAELWMYPPLLVTQPAMGRSCVAYRKKTIGSARRRAASNGQRGAQYPWEAAFTGEEMTPTWAETRDFQLHITADVAIGQWWYYLVTGDLNWLRTEGYPVIKECAEYWESRVEYNAAKGRYEISDVVCADEYAEHVNNDAFTNAAVRKALLIAVRAAELLGEKAPERWLEIAAKIHIPYDAERCIHLEYDGFDGALTKQADVELLAYPLEHTTDHEQIARDLDYYGTVIDPHGPAMSFSVYSIISAQLGRADQACEYLRKSYAPNTRPPFYAFSETPVNDEYFFCTGVGGALQSLLFGFSGLRLREGAFKIDPVLPGHWTGLRLKGLFLAGARTDIEIERDSVRVRRHLDDQTVELFVNRAEGTAVFVSAQPLHVRFLCNGNEVWEGKSSEAHVRFPAADPGELRLEVVDDEGRRLFDMSIPMRSPATPNA